MPGDIRDRFYVWLHKWWPTMTILTFFGLIAVALALSGCRIGLSIG